MTEERLRPEGEEKIHPTPGSTLPGTGGPTTYPNSPDGGPISGAEALVDALPGGTARWPEPAPAVGPQQGAGQPSAGGLTPNPGEVANGTIQTGWKGNAYSNENDIAGSTVPGLSTPSDFTGL